MWYLILLPAALILLAYYFRRHLLARLLELPPPHFSVAVDRAIPVPMSDGVDLLADHYWPKADGEFPTILIRTPYGRGREVFLFGGYPMAELPGQRFAERGYHVIVQGVRGCYDSEGEFEPHINEAPDGRSTVDWIQEQPWYDGRLAVWGPSYLGYTAWSTAATSVQHLSAIVAVITSSENYSVTHPSGAFGLETRLRWTQGLATARQLHSMSLPAKLRRRFFGKPQEALEAAYKHLPLREADEVAAGEPLPFYREMLANRSVDDDYWIARDHTGAVAQVEAPVHLIGGWYDYYLPGLLRDYASLKNAGRDPHLTIGPWHHASGEGLLTGLREGLRWFDAQLKEEEQQKTRQPVKVYVMGDGEWRDMPEFPPPSRPIHYYLGANGSLRRVMPGNKVVASDYVYDPADPTPTVGGALLSFKGAGPVDNRELEARADVLSFTSSELHKPLRIIGRVTLTLYIKSSRPFTDFFGRLCDVFPDGRSINVCDGLTRIQDSPEFPITREVTEIIVDLSATAYCFLPGHRLRVQLSSGSHPRWARNSGTGESDATAVDLVVAEQQVFHDREHPSAITLPLV